MDVKVLQYIMGHANIAVTMEVYNHITEHERIEKEIIKMGYNGKKSQFIKFSESANPPKSRVCKNIQKILALTT